MKNAWRVLGLKRGADRNAVRRAYAQKLKCIHPEDDPQGFMELREAYERLFQASDNASAVARFDEEILADPASVFERGRVADLPATDDGVTAPEPGPDPEQAELEHRLQELADHLHYNGVDRAKSKDLVGQVIASSVLQTVDVVQQTEIRLAEMILGNLPASDAIILQAVEAFGWSDQRHAQRYPFSQVINRLDEWRTIQSLNRSDDPHGKAWRVLSDPPGKLHRWWLARTARRHDIAELLLHIEYEVPGLRYSIDPRAVDWWTDELERQRTPIDSLLWRIAGGMLLGIALSGDVHMPTAFMVGGILGIFFLGDFLLMQRLLPRFPEPLGVAAQLMVIATMLLLPIAALLLPSSWVSVTALGMLAYLLCWAARLSFAAPTGVARERRVATAIGLAVLAWLFLAAEANVTAIEAVLAAAIFWLLQTQLPLLRQGAAATIDRVTGNLTWPALFVYAAATWALAWYFPASDGTPLARAAFAVAATYAAGGIAAFAARPVPPLILGVSIVFANLALFVAAGRFDNKPINRNVNQAVVPLADR